MLRWGADRLPLEEIWADTDVDAFVMLHEGDLVHEWYARPEAEQSRHRIYSITKSFVGVVAGESIQRGLLDRGRPATDYVPELGGGGYSPADVGDLLDMRTGGDYVEHEDDEVATMLACQSGAPGAPFASVPAMLCGTARVARHRGPFSYRSLDTEALGWVVERAAGASMVSLLSEVLLGPLGCEADAAVDVGVDGSPAHSSGLALRPRDVARFGQMLLDSGAVGERQIVAPGFVKDLRRNGAAGYRGQFWVPDPDGRRLLALGVHGQVMLVDAATATVAVVLSDWLEPRDQQRLSRTYDVLLGCGAQLGGMPAPGHSLSR